MGIDEDMAELYELHAEAEAAPPRLVVILDRAAWLALLPRVHRLWPYRVVRVPRAVALDDVAPTVEIVSTIATDPESAAVEIGEGLDLAAWSEIVVVASRGRETWRLATTCPHVRLVRPGDVE